MKYCKVCTTSKPLTDFSVMSTARDGLRHACKACMNARAKADRAARPEFYRDQRQRLRPQRQRDNRRRARFKKYGLTHEMFEQRLVDQNSACAVCKTGIDELTCSVDHCHDGGHVRGLLCRSCNLALGHAQDSVERLNALVAYLVQDRTP